MMKKNEIRLRLNRLAGGSRNVEDLNRIFNWLRFRSHGDPTIADIGHFAAHQDQRNQGIIWKRAADIFHNARLFLSLVHAERTGRSWFDMPIPQVERSLLASLTLIGPDLVRSDTRISFSRAKRCIRSIAEKMRTRGNKLTDEEQSIFDYLIRRMSPEPVFSQDELLESFLRVLGKEHLLEPDMVPALRGQSDFLAVYVLSIMHLCEIDVGSSDAARLVVGVQDDGRLVGAAEMENVAANVGIGTPLFTTNLRAETWVVFPEEKEAGRFFTFTHPLELDSDCRLREI